MHLLGLIYWLRTELGEPVEAVYGFYFCGRRCENQDNNTYLVGLIKLSAPKWLGENVKRHTIEDIALKGLLTIHPNFLRLRGFSVASAIER
jgi:hypothetical protein